MLSRPKPLPIPLSHKITKGKPFMSNPPMTAYPIAVTADEIASACEALRYMAGDMHAGVVFNRRARVNAALTLAYALEARHRAAVIEAGRVETVGEEEE